VASRCFDFLPKPSRDFVPVADSLSCARKKVSKESAPAPSPLRFATGFPAMLERRGPRGTHSATLRSNSRAESVDEVRCAHASAFCASRLLQRGTPEQPKTTAKPAGRLAPAVGYAPFSTAEERKVLKPCAQRTSRTDSAQLFEQSVAARVLRGASRPDVLSQDRAQHLRAVRRLTKDLPHASGKARRAPAAQRRAVRSGGALCLLSGGPESRSPAGANSRHHSPRKTAGAKT
jgi:hypothetical protein